MTLKRVATICIRLVGVAVLLVVEDSVLWIAPAGAEGAVASARAANFQSRCGEIKAGMSRDEVLETIHQGTSIWRETYRRSEMNGEGREFFFEGYRATCTVAVDPATGKALGAHLQLPQGSLSYDE